VVNPDHRFDTLEIRAPLFTTIRRATNTVRDELLQSFQLRRARWRAKTSRRCRCA
jgi:ATP-dependent DNA helicase RecG